MLNLPAVLLRSVMPSAGEVRSLLTMPAFFSGLGDDVHPTIGLSRRLLLRKFLNSHLGADFDDAVDGDLEVGGGVFGLARHPDEDFVLE